MNQHKLELIFFFSILIGVLTLSFFIFYPYLYSLLLAIVFAIIFRSLYNRILKLFHGRNALAALATLAIVLITVMIPLVFLGTQIFQEAETVYTNLSSGGGSTNIDAIEANINSWLNRNLGIVSNPIKISLDVDLYLRSSLTWLFQNVGTLVSSITNITVNLFIFLFAFYYLLKDGEKFRNSVIEFSPLPDRYDVQIATKVENAVNSVVKGTVVIGLIQGFMTGLGFFIFGVPNPAFWGAAAAIASFIPGVGTALIGVPGALFLIFTGNILPGIGLLVWGMVAVGLVDNFLGPKLVQRGMRIHSFFILLFALGGLSFFGPIGFLLGPIVLSFLFALTDIYTLVVKEHAH